MAQRRRSATNHRAPSRPTDEQEQWYRDAVIYEAHVKTFMDSDDDGIGDLQGLISKLDYLQDLGVTALWLLPFYPSPLRDDGYDIASYRDIHPSYGTLRDFRTLLREAHERGLYVITELVMNHTSDQHPWFQRARRARPGSPERDFYVWSDTPDKYAEARIIFQDFEHSNWTWDREAGAYYWHRFYSHQPDLNFDNPEVHRAMFGVVDFWLDMGVDGLRLDAVPYLFEREGTTGENLPETFDFLRDPRRHIDDRFRNRMLLAEANQWPEDAVAYFGKGDMCHMAFHFPAMPRMFMATRMEDRFPIIDILEQTPPIPGTAQWAIFLRNHDELTLEMVTDEERDYMYRVYADDPQARINLGIRRRLAPLLRNDRRTIELMNGLLCSLPGTPVIYYGDEIGMGDNIYLGDRHGVRTPMQWSTDRNAGFSDANPQRLYLPVVIDPGYGPEAINVEAQQNNPASLLWWMKRLIGLRKRYAAFGRGELEFLYPENRKVLTFLRRLGDEGILVVANLSRYAQYVELDLSEFQGHQPIALLGGVEFPRIGELPYLLTLGPHDFYWFALEPARALDAPSPSAPTLDVKGTWRDVFEDGGARLDAALPGYLRGRRWFGSKGRRIKGAAVSRVIPVPSGGAASRPIGYLTFVDVEYGEGEGETYVLPIAWSLDDAQPEYLEATPIAHLRTSDGEGFLHDAVFSPAFNTALLNTIRRRRRLQDGTAQVTGHSTPVLRRRGSGSLEPSLLGAEQSNTSVQFGDALVLKLFRKLESGVNPDLEIGRFLTDRNTFQHTPKVAGGLEFRDNGDVSTLAILQEYVPNEGDAWTYTLDVLGRYFEDVLARRGEEPTLPQKSLIELTDIDCPELAAETIGSYLGNARLL